MNLSFVSVILVLWSFYGSCLHFNHKYLTDKAAIQLEVSTTILGDGSDAYVAVALAREPLMKEADGYYCTNTKLKSFVIQSRWSNPVELSMNDAMSTISLSDGLLHCTFERPLSVKKKIHGDTLYDFDVTREKYYVLLATGKIQSELMSKHGEVKTLEKIDFFEESSQSIPSHDKDGRVDQSKCSVSKECIAYPAGCLTTDPDCLFMSMRQVADGLEIELSGGTGDGNEYIAVAFGIANQMRDADLYYCNGKHVQSAVIREFAKLPADLYDESIQIKMGSTSNGVGQCRFTRNICVIKEISNGSKEDFDLGKKSYHILLAYGNMSSDGKIRNHGLENRLITKDKYVLANGTSYPYTCEPTSGLATAAMTTLTTKNKFFKLSPHLTIYFFLTVISMLY